MNTRQIEAFRAVARSGTVTGAAQQLHVSQPAVSRLLAHLELQLGLQLFARSQGRLHLTPEGAALLVEVERHFVGMGSIQSAARQIAAHGPGSLRLIAFPSLTSGPLPSAVAAHLDAHPGTAMTLDTDTTDQIATRVESGAYDVGFTAGDTNVGAALNATRITSRPWVCVFPPGHRFAGRRKVTISQLAREALVGFSPGMSLRGRIDRLFTLRDQEPRYSLCAQTIESICALVQSGCGSAIIHPYAKHVATSKGLITTTLTDAPPLDLVTVTRKQPARARIVDEFVQLATQFV